MWSCASSAVQIRTLFQADWIIMSRLVLLIGMLIAATPTLAQSTDVKRFCLRSADAAEMVCFSPGQPPQVEKAPLEQPQLQPSPEQAELRAELERREAAAREQMGK